MKMKAIVAAVFVLVAWAIFAMLRSQNSPEVTYGNPDRPSPLVQELPRLPVKLEEEMTRTRVVAAAVKSRSSQALPGTDWAVVAATYREYGAADRRARTIAANSPFQARVHPPKGQGSKYMVVLDAGLTHPKAESTRAEAAAKGLPPDTYVTRLFGTE